MVLRLLGDHVAPSYTELPPRSLELELAHAGRRPLQRGDRPTLFEMLRSLPLRAQYFERQTYAGIPARASAELGERYLELLAGEAADGLYDVLTGKTPISECYSPLWKLRHVFLNEALGRVFDRVVRTRVSPV
jgi:hypothetical protein